MTLGEFRKLFDGFSDDMLVIHEYDSNYSAPTVSIRWLYLHPTVREMGKEREKVTVMEWSDAEYSDELKRDQIHEVLLIK